MSKQYTIGPKVVCLIFITLLLFLISPLIMALILVLGTLCYKAIKQVLVILPGLLVSVISPILGIIVVLTIIGYGYYKNIDRIHDFVSNYI